MLKIRFLLLSVTCMVMLSLVLSDKVFAASLDDLSAETDVSTTTNVAKEISDINARVAVLSARLSEIEMKAKIASKLSEIDKIENGEGVGAGGNSAALPNQPPVLPVAPMTGNLALDLTGDVSTIPGIKEIDGIDGKLRATLYLDNGGTQIVRVGDHVGDWVVKNITIDSVTVQKGKQLKKLPFGSSMSVKSPSPSSGAYGGSTPSLVPPIPQMPASSF